MNRDLNAIREKLKSASLRMLPAKILDPGAYSFRIESVSEEYDSVRKYSYIFIKLWCSDRVRTTDRLFGERKLEQFLASVGMSVEDGADLQQLAGRLGRLIAEKSGKWTLYQYQPQP